MDRDLFQFHHKNERQKIKPVVFRANQGRWFFTQHTIKLPHGVIDSENLHDLKGWRFRFLEEK